MLAAPGEHRSELSEPFRHSERSERSNQTQLPHPILKTSNVVAIGTPNLVPA